MGGVGKARLVGATASLLLDAASAQAKAGIALTLRCQNNKKASP
jgi:hypothetical protein